jgi:hypothetical protein
MPQAGTSLSHVNQTTTRTVVQGVRMLADSYSAWVRTTADYLPQVTRKAYSSVWPVLAARPRVWGQREYRSPRAGEHTTATGERAEQAKHQVNWMLAGCGA